MPKIPLSHNLSTLALHRGTIANLKARIPRAINEEHAKQLGEEIGTLEKACTDITGKLTAEEKKTLSADPRLTAPKS